MRRIISSILLLFIISLFITSCSSSSSSSSGDCCQECLEKANRDPSGYDISIKPCSEYGLVCEKSVGECQTLPLLDQ